jgi:N-acetylmuramoyl-L-alanine amidase
VPTFESVGGRTLAECLTNELSRCGLDLDEPTGLRLPVLRETKMPAVLCSFAPVRTAVDAAPAIGAAIGRALHTWMRVWTLIA